MRKLQPVRWVKAYLAQSLLQVDRDSLWVPCPAVTAQFKAPPPLPMDQPKAFLRFSLLQGQLRGNARIAPNRQQASRIHQPQFLASAPLQPFLAIVIMHQIPNAAHAQPCRFLKERDIPLTNRVFQ